MEPARKQEVINVCLETFMKKGLAHTSTRDFCKALNLNTGGVFYYFESKDDIVIACAKEAVQRTERELMEVALKSIEHPKQLMEEICACAETLRPLMQFFVSVCASAKYEAALQPILDGLAKRYEWYAERFAQVLQCEPEEIAPYVHIGMDSMISYMLFGQNSVVVHPLTLVYHALEAFLEKRDQKDNASA